MESIIKVVSLGPGDPDMITLKGLKTLREADVIFCPVTRKGQQELSRSADMVETLGVDTSKIERYYLPMSKDREQTIKIYNEVAQHCVDLSQRGKRVVVTAEGDGGFFSSSQYIHEMIIQRGAEVRRVAGVPAFIDCAALAGIHIASGDRGLEVIPSIKSPSDIIDRVEQRRANIVLMKLSQSEDAIKSTIEMVGKRAKFHYIENRGRADEFYTQSTDIILERKFPYFSILIIEIL